jgi:putative transcriptional regulator
MTRVVIGRNSKPRKRQPSGRAGAIKGRTDWRRLPRMKESEVIAGARAGRDAPPLPRKHVAAFNRVSHTPDEVKAIRRKSGLSQTAFAARYGLNLRTLQDWEQGRVQPDGPARSYLLVILREPRAVERALAAGGRR